MIPSDVEFVDGLVKDAEDEITQLRAANAALLKAAGVISLTPHIVAYLQTNDRKALEQVRNAFVGGRTAKCHCGRAEPSHGDLAFFEYCGPGSRDADEICECGFHRCAHERQPENVDPRSVIEDGRCKGKEFRPRGDRGFDRFYCGCSGWD